MPLLIASLACWCCLALSFPRRALPDREAEERAYIALLGRQQRLTLLAVMLSIVALLALALAQPITENADLHAVRESRGSCVDGISGVPVCYRKQANGTWAWMELREGGQWTTAAPPPSLRFVVDDSLDRPRG